MSALYEPNGPYDLTYKPDRISSGDWSVMPQARRDRIRDESPAYRAECGRERAEYRRQLEEDRRAFRARFPLVDLDGIPRRAWGLPPGSRCSQCPVDADWPGVQHGQSGLECWLWQAAYFYCEQAGACTWCGEVMAANLVKTAIDHVIPRSLDGPDTRWNRQLLHLGCNSRKGARLTARARELADARGFVIPGTVLA